MTGRRPKGLGPDLTDLELEVMNEIWVLEKVTVREVCDLLNKKREFAYTTIATIFKFLEKKGYLKSSKMGNLLIYSVKISKKMYQDWYLQNKMGQVFDSPSSLVTRFIDETDLNQKEIDKIKKALEKLDF